MNHNKAELGSRVLIVGCSGAGKTSLALALQDMTGLPVIHLDTYYWKDDWEARNTSEWNQILDELCSREQWIMDGNYSSSLAKRVDHASSIIYLDMPRWLCLYRVILRRFRLWHNKKRPDLAENCHERINLSFYKWIWNYRKRTAKKTQDLLSELPIPVIHIRSKKQLNKWIMQLS